MWGIRQGIIYACTSLPNPTGSTLLGLSVQKFLTTVRENIKPEILWTLHYTQYYTLPASVTKFGGTDASSSVQEASSSSNSENRILQLEDVPSDLAVEDSVLENVKQAWEKIVGKVPGEHFLMFEDRELMGEDGEDDQEDSL